MSNELSVINNNFPSQMDLQSIGLIARTAHMSKLYGGVGDEAKIMMILLAAKELGVGPCQALNGGIWSIQGKIEISARLMNGLIRRAGHSIKVITSNDTECTLRGTRTDGDSFECTFTMEDAVKAGLAGGNVWKKYPGDMLYNRCMSRLGRRLFSDVIGQCYIEGELKEAKEIENLEKAECEDVSQNRYIPEEEPKPPTPPLPPESEPAPQPKISEEHAQDLFNKIDALPEEWSKKLKDFALKEFGAKMFKDLPESQYIHFLGHVDRAWKMIKEGK